MDKDATSTFRRVSRAIFRLDEACCIHIEKTTGTFFFAISIRQTTYEYFKNLQVSSLFETSLVTNIPRVYLSKHLLTPE